MKKRTGMQIPIVMVAATALVACGSAGAGGEEDGVVELTMAHDGTASSAAVSLGIDQGFFEEEGLDIEFTTVGQPPATVAAVQSGEVDVGSVPTIPTVNAIGEGLPLTSIASVSGYPDPAEVEDMTVYDTFGIYVAPDSDFDSPSDLEGQDVAVPAREAVFEVLIADAVREDGGDPSNVNWIVLDFQSQITSLTSGRVDAAGLPLPFTVQAGHEGAQLLEQPGIAFYEQGPTSVWNASAQVAEDDELVSKLQRAIHRSNEYANEHRDEAVERAAEITGIDVAVLEESTGFNYFPTTFQEEDIERVNRKMAELDFLAEAVDLSGNLETYDGN